MPGTQVETKRREKVTEEVTTFSRFWGRTMLMVPGAIVRAANGAVAFIGVLLVGVALFNRPLARELASWQGVSPWWALLPFSLLLTYGLMRVVHAEFQEVERQRNEAQHKLAEELERQTTVRPSRTGILNRPSGTVRGGQAKFGSSLDTGIDNEGDVDAEDAEFE